MFPGVCAFCPISPIPRTEKGRAESPGRRAALADARLHGLSAPNSEIPWTAPAKEVERERSSFYYASRGDSPLNLRLMRRIDEQFLETPFYGSRQMTRWLRRQGDMVSRKRVRRTRQVVRIGSNPNQIARRGGGVPRRSGLPQNRPNRLRRMQPATGHGANGTR